MSIMHEKLLKVIIYCRLAVSFVETLRNRLSINYYAIFSCKAVQVTGDLNQVLFHRSDSRESWNAIEEQ